MKRSCIILLAALAGAMMVSCGQHRGDVNSLKVISFNVRHSAANDGQNSWVYRRPAAVAMLKEQNPDVFGVQEARYDQLEYLSAGLPEYACVGIGRDDGKSLGEHMSIFYNTGTVELLDWGTYWLSETPEVPSMGWGAHHYRTATWTRMRHIPSGNEFFYVNTHLDHQSKEAQKNGLALVVDRIAQMNPDGAPMILTGDFNVHPDDEILTDLDSIMKSARVYAEVSDTTASFNGWGTSSQVIDYIYYSVFPECKMFKVLNETYEGVDYISDHYPVVALLEF